MVPGRDTPSASFCRCHLAGRVRFLAYCCRRQPACPCTASTGGGWPMPSPSPGQAAEEPNPGAGACAVRKGRGHPPIRPARPPRRTGPGDLRDSQHQRRARRAARARQLLRHVRPRERRPARGKRPARKAERRGTDHRLRDPGGQAQVTLFDVSAIGGEAVSPLVGPATRLAYRILFTAANIRLGLWLPHPSLVRDASRWLDDQNTAGFWWERRPRLLLALVPDAAPVLAP